MNLINDAWLPVLRADGPDKIAPWQIVELENPVLELAAPRPDFQGALYQFLIGLLQTCFAPSDHDDWLEYWDEMPVADDLKEKFGEVALAFELDNPDGPAFMQDFNLEGKKKEPITALLIDFPGNKTLKDNADFFVKGGTVDQLCPACAARGLLTLQLNAPSGGNGHRVGVRGGGPLTTLVLPAGKADLWSKLWLNVLDSESFEMFFSSAEPEIFPWLGPTRLSTQKKVNKVKTYINGGVPTTPEDVNSLQCFWGMPRRMRLIFEKNGQGRCDLCNSESDQFVKQIQTGTWGVDYVGAWVHPLTPYRYDPDKKEPPLSLKGQQGGLGYRHWLGLTMIDQASGDCAAKVTQAYMEERAHSLRSDPVARLWCFGYDMDNMKARCWYDHEMPLLRLDAGQRKNLLDWAKELVDAATDVANTLRGQLKEAWFKRTKDVKGDMSAVVSEFWQQSEAEFYTLLNTLSTLPTDQRRAPPEIYAGWAKTIRRLAFDLFDSWALESPAEDLDMKRIVKARQGLQKKISTNKSMKTLVVKSKPEEEGKDGE